MLNLAERSEANVQIVAISGEVDAQTCQTLESKLQQLVDQGITRIVLDFSGVPFIASAGMGVLMAFIGDIQDKGGDMVIAGAQPDVYRTFDLLDFTSLFKFTPDVRQALASFGG